MRDKDGFIIKCKHSDWQIIDDDWNHEDVCLMYGNGLYRYICYADEHCEHYVPDVKEDGAK